MMCAGGYTKRSICGDSDAGGPLSYKDKISNRHFLIGVASTAETCGDSPSLFTDVFEMKDWLDEKMKNAKTFQGYWRKGGA